MCGRRRSHVANGPGAHGHSVAAIERHRTGGGRVEAADVLPPRGIAACGRKAEACCRRLAPCATPHRNEKPKPRSAQATQCPRSRHRSRSPAAPSQYEPPPDPEALRAIPDLRRDDDCRSQSTGFAATGRPLYLPPRLLGLQRLLGRHPREAARGRLVVLPDCPPTRHRRFPRLPRMTFSAPLPDPSRSPLPFAPEGVRIVGHISSEGGGDEDQRTLPRGMSAHRLTLLAPAGRAEIDRGFVRALASERPTAGALADLLAQSSRSRDPGSRQEALEVQRGARSREGGSRRSRAFLGTARGGDRHRAPPCAALSRGAIHDSRIGFEVQGRHKKIPWTTAWRWAPSDPADPPLREFAGHMIPLGSPPEELLAAPFASPP